MDVIEFLATIPNARSAWTVSGDSPPAATVKLEIPSSQFHRVMRLMNEGHERTLRVSIQIED